MSLTDEYVPLRPPVLGLRIDRRAESDAYRVVQVEPALETLAEGSLEECERALLAALLERHGPGKRNFPLPTLGGAQLWADVYWFAGWRIQENVYTGHFRLLDPEDVRRAWGTHESCRVAFERERVEHDLAPSSTHLVVLLHGLGRTKHSLSGMRAALRREGFEVAALNYPSTRRSLAEHAAGLTRVLEHLEGIERVSFVTHSLGGLLARQTLADRDAPWRRRIEVGRLCMLAPPSRGSSFADTFKEFLPFQWIAGPAGMQTTLAEAAKVPLPEVPFGILAGSQNGGRGRNPIVPGDDDGVVGVEETRLDGAEDFLVVKGMHSFLMSDPRTIEAAVRYLKTGRFEE